MKGYTGKILNVDLTDRTIKEEFIEDAVYEKYLSGVGLAAYLLYDRIPKNADPLGPENILGLVTGMLCGTGSFFSGRWMAVGKSPLTGGWGDASGGGYFGPSIKRAGYDGVFFKGISSEPVYLYVDNHRAELRNARELWGKDAVEAEEMILGGIKTKIKPAVAIIGTSGEKLSYISGISHDKGRIAARSGLGAVMGSKRLKAVVFAASGQVRVKNRKKLKELQYELDNVFRNTPKFNIPGWALRLMAKLVMARAKTTSPLDGIYAVPSMRKWGTGANNQLGIELGDSPIMNWKGSKNNFTPRQSKQFNPDRIMEIEFEKYQCHSCPMGCGGKVRSNDKFKETHKPEYESANQFGALLLNKSRDALLYMTELANRAGIDTISAGGVIAFSLECYQKGILTTLDTDGLELTWGDSKAIVALLEKIINREGIGDILADGVRIAARKIGRGSEQYAIHAGGQELPAHDPRHDPNFGIHYSVEPTPGRHTIGSQTEYGYYRIWERIKSFPEPKKKPVSEKYTRDQKGEMAVGCSVLKMLTDSAGFCYFGLYVGLTRHPIMDFMNAAADWNKSDEEYAKIGKRIQTLRHMFNIKHGLNPWDQKVHPRAVGRPPLTDGILKGKTFDLEPMMMDYWQTMGWNPETGIPEPETLNDLGLSQAITDLESL